MTEDRVTEYLRAVERELPPAWPRRETVLRDLRLHMEAAVESGATAEEAIIRLGPPAAVAATLLEDYEPTLAPLPHRAAAFVLDVGIGWAVVWAGVGTFMLVSGDGDLVPRWLVFGWLIAAAVLAVAYFPAFEATLGRTPGKMLVGLHVIRADGHPVGWKEAVLRRLPLFFEFFWLDALFAPFTKRKQRAFDIVASTLVVRSGGGNVALAWVLGVLLWSVPVLYLAVSHD